MYRRTNSMRGVVALLERGATRTPDGLPVIGRPPAIENATLAAGHGMWWLQLAPVTAELVAQVISGGDVGPVAPLRADRFQLRARSSAEPLSPFVAGAP